MKHHSVHSRYAILLWLFGCLLGSISSIAWAGELQLPPDIQPVVLQPGQKVFPYFNPVLPQDAPDPAVLRVGEHIYAAATGQGIYRSTNMVDWVRVGTMFSAGLPEWVDPAQPDIWAPDLNYIAGQYVLYFSARANGYDEYRGVGVAWSEKPAGPYTGKAEALAVGPGFRHIDPMAFLDDDGTRYLYWGSAHQPILVQELAADGLSLVGKPEVALWPDPSIRYSRLVEGPWVIKRADYYYMFWSGDGYNPGYYATSVGRATSPKGPFLRWSMNPILLESPDYTSPGHNAIIQDDAGQDWIFYHAYDVNNTERGRFLLIDQLIWQDGWPVVAGRIPSSKPIAAGPVWQSDAIPFEEVAYNKPVSVSSQQSGKPATAAVDANTTTGWQPQAADAAPWLQVDLGATRRISQIELGFRGSGQHFLVEVSVTGSDWEVWADGTAYGASYPVILRNEMLARYVRVSRITAAAGVDTTLYDLRVAVYQGVWLVSPGSGTAGSGTPIEVHIDLTLSVKQVTVKLAGQTLYTGTESPWGELAILDVVDGAYELELQVLDTNDTSWQHTCNLQVQSTQIKGLQPGQKLGGTIQPELTTSFPDTAIAEVQVMFTPILEGELQAQAATLLYRGLNIPKRFYLNTLAYPDGAYNLGFSVQHKNGSISKANVNVVVANWNVLHDPFELPKESGWFGVIDLKKTVDETVGWDYAADNAGAFMEDANRLIWTGSGVGYLTWAVPHLHHYKVVLYTKGNEPTGVKLSVSQDQQSWESVSWQAQQTSQPVSGWVQWELTGELTTPGARFFRLGLDATLRADQAQLGLVKLVSVAQ